MSAESDDSLVRLLHQRLKLFIFCIFCSGEMGFLSVVELQSQNHLSQRSLKP